MYLFILSLFFFFSHYYFLNIFIYLFPYFLYLRFLLFFSLHFCLLSSLLSLFVFIPLSVRVFVFRSRQCCCTVVCTSGRDEPSDRYCHRRSGHIGSTAMGNQLHVSFRADPHERYMACLGCTDPVIRLYMCVNCK